MEEKVTHWGEFFTIERYTSYSPIWFGSGDGSSYSFGSTFHCNHGKWNTYAVEVNLLEDGSLSYSFKIDGVIKRQFGSTKTHTGNYKIFVSNDQYPAAKDYLVRNFYYQPIAFSDFSAGLNKSYISTVPAASSYKASVDVLCTHSMDLVPGRQSILKIETGRV